MSLPARHSRGDIPAAKTLKKQIRDESAAGHRQTASVLSPFNGRTSAPLREVSGNSLPEPFSIITHSGNRLSIGHTAPAGLLDKGKAAARRGHAAFEDLQYAGHGRYALRQPALRRPAPPGQRDSDDPHTMKEFIKTYGPNAGLEAGAETDPAEA